MTFEKATARLLGAFLTTALSVGIAACGDDDSGDKDAGTVPVDTGVAPVDTGTPADTGITPVDTGVSAGDGGATACLSAVYAPLSDGCSACTCAVDPVLAPSCQGPCWDFLACSFAAQAGPCKAAAEGGAATRPQFEACTMTECGAQLAVPGAEVVSSYRTIIGGCAVPMGATPPACGADIAMFTANLKKP